MYACMFLLLAESKAWEFSSESQCCTQVIQFFHCALWCHAALLHTDCIYLNATSNIDDHYSFSLKSVREKLLQTLCKQQQMSWYEVMMPLEIEKCSFCFFPVLSETTAAATQLLKKPPAFTIFVLVCAGDSREMRLQTVTQWILDGFRSLWGFAGSGEEITLRALVKHQICSSSDSFRKQSHMGHSATKW